jgi:uroporphyrinogen-III synthase
MANSIKTYGVFEQNQNKKFIQSLIGDGCKIISFPQIEYYQSNLSENETKYLRNPENTDWLIFTDINSVEYFIRFYENNSLDLYELDNLRVIAFGEAVSDSLRFVQIHSDIIVDNFDDQMIFDQIKEYLLGVEGLFELNILFIKGNQKNYYLTELLKEAKANIRELSIYQSKLPEDSTKLKTLAINGAIDEFIFLRAEEVFDLSLYFYPQKINDELDEIQMIGTDEITLKTLREFGLSPVIIK